MLTSTHIISLYKSKLIEIHPQDILLLMNLLQSNTSLKSSENWIPICLPGISPDGVVYSYIYYLSKNVGKNIK